MAIQIQFRRGTNSALVGAAGEVTVRTDLATLAVHDGSTAGGSILASEDYVDDAIAATATGVAANLLLSMICT